MDDFYRRHLERADRAIKGKSVAEVMNRVRAIIGPSNMPSGEQGQLAQEALDALRNFERPTAKQLAALEFIIRLMRPVPPSRQGTLDEIDSDIVPDFPDWPGFRNSIKPFLYSVGRIDMLPKDSIGTGFLVSDTLLVTNRHVVDQMSKGTGMLEKGQSVVRFKYELGTNEDDDSDVDIIEVAAIHEVLDIALLRVEKQEFNEARQPVSLDPTEVEAGHQVVAVGYPFDDSRRNPLFINALFDGRFGVKRAALGEVSGVAEQAIFHDCSTLGGNSGSPIFSMKSAKVIGLHREGFFMYRNEAVKGQPLSTFVEQYV